MHATKLSIVFTNLLNVNQEKNMIGQCYRYRERVYKHLNGIVYLLGNYIEEKKIVKYMFRVRVLIFFKL